MNAIGIINSIEGIIGVIGPATLDLILKIKALIEQAKLGSVDVKAVGDEAIAADDATMASINQWLVANGFPPLPTV